MPVLLPQLEGQQKCDRRLDANFALDRVLLSFPAAVARRPEAGKQRLGRSKSGPNQSIGIVTRFVYYEFRARARKQIDRSVLSQKSDSISPPPLRH